MPTNHIGYFQYLKYYDNFYEGTKLGNFNTSFRPGNTTWNQNENFSPFTEQDWEDIATASFYRVQYDQGGNNTLRIVRPDVPETNQNQTN
jgi:hypothetical protein